MRLLWLIVPAALLLAGCVIVPVEPYGYARAPTERHLRLSRVPLLVRASLLPALVVSSAGAPPAARLPLAASR